MPVARCMSQSVAGRVVQFEKDHASRKALKDGQKSAYDISFLDFNCRRSENSKSQLLLFDLFRVRAVNSVKLCTLEMQETTAAACRATTCVVIKQMCV